MASALVNALRSQAAESPRSNPVLLEDVVINRELLLRPVRTVDSRAEFTGMHALANLIGRSSHIILKRLAQLAIELCDADTGGISMIEAGNDGLEIFRWQALAGELEQYEGGTTPREWSPCGECLKCGRPMLYSYPARFFTYFQNIDTVIVEGLVIPLCANGVPVGTIWIVSHTEQRRFDAEDVRVMTSLGSFVIAALQVELRRTPGFADEARVDGREVVWGEFVRRIAWGDAAALEALITETKPFVFGRALKIVSFRADAEEITADVYSQVWNIAVRYDRQRGSVLSWLLNIASSRALDRLRSRITRQRSEASLMFEYGSATDPEANAAYLQTKARVRQALQALPFQQRRAIELAYFQGYSMTDIASRLGHPVGTVKTRIRMGLIGLRRLIATTETSSFDSFFR